MYTDAQKRSHIFDLQTFLRRIQQAEGSAAPLVPDGIWDAKTAAAVREYQQQNCLPVTGIAVSSHEDSIASIFMVNLLNFSQSTGSFPRPPDCRSTE